MDEVLKARMLRKLDRDIGAYSVDQEVRFDHKILYGMNPYLLHMRKEMYYIGRKDIKERREKLYRVFLEDFKKQEQELWEIDLAYKPTF